MVTKTPEEWAEMGPEERREHLTAEEKIVFGANVQHKNGRPIEQGIGSPGHESGNHFAAIRKYEGEDAYHRACAAAWKANPENANRLGLPKQ